MSWERECFFSNSHSVLPLDNTVTGGLVAAMRDRELTWHEGWGLSQLCQSLCRPMAWSGWYGLETEVKLVISVLYRCHTDSSADVHTWAIYPIHCNLCTDPSFCRSIDSHCTTLSSNGKAYGNFWIPCIPHVSLDKTRALLWTLLLSHLPPPMLKFSPYIILSMLSNSKQSELTGIYREANHYAQFSWNSPYLGEHSNDIPPILLFTLRKMESKLGLIPLPYPVFFFPSCLRTTRDGFFSHSGTMSTFLMYHILLIFVMASVLCSLSWNHDGLMECLRY